MCRSLQHFPDLDAVLCLPRPNCSQQFFAVSSASVAGDDDDDEDAVDVAAVVSRLQPLIKRAVDDHGQPLTSLSAEGDGDVGAGSEAFQRLKSVLTAEFSDAVTVEKEIGMRVAAVISYPAFVARVCCWVQCMASTVHSSPACVCVERKAQITVARHLIAGLHGVLASSRARGSGDCSKLPVARCVSAASGSVDQ